MSVFGEVLALWWKAPTQMLSAFFCAVFGQQQQAEQHIRNAQEKRHG